MPICDNRRAICKCIFSNVLLFYCNTFYWTLLERRLQFMFLFDVHVCAIVRRCISIYFALQIRSSQRAMFPHSSFEYSICIEYNLHFFIYVSKSFALLSKKLFDSLNCRNRKTFSYKSVIDHWIMTGKRFRIEYIFALYVKMDHLNSNRIVPYRKSDWSFHLHYVLLTATFQNWFSTLSTPLHNSAKTYSQCTFWNLQATRRAARTSTNVKTADASKHGSALPSATVMIYVVRNHKNAIKSDIHSKLFCSSANISTCRIGQFECASTKKCIPVGWMCDGDPDCGIHDVTGPDRSDETSEKCES